MSTKIATKSVMLILFTIFNLIFLYNTDYMEYNKFALQKIVLNQNKMILFLM